MTYSFRQILLTALLSCAATGAFATDFVEDGIAYDVYDATNLQLQVVLDESLYVGDITIPARVEHDGQTYTVVSLHDQAFFQCKNLTAITIPATVEELGSYTFSQCTSLASVTLPEGITAIPDGCFVYCSALTSVTLPESVTEIGAYGFGYCSSLSSINIDDRITELGNMALIGTALKSFALPSDLDRVPSYLLALNTQLSSVALHDGVTEIGECAFQGDPRLTAITLPETLTTLEASAFAQCTGLKAISIPDDVTAIPQRCFYNDMALETVVLGTGVTTIGTDAFARYKTDAPQLKHVYLKADQVVSGGSSFIDEACAQATLHVPAALLDSYKADNDWRRFSTIVALDGTDPTAIQTATAAPVDTPSYNIAGQRVAEGTHGLLINNGKKTIKK